MRGGGAPAALAPFSPRYSIGMAREAVRASESLVQARLPRSWTTIVLAQQRRPMGRTASRASDAIERPMPTQSRQMPMSLRRVGTGWRAGWMQSADRWRESGRKPAERRQEQPPRCLQKECVPVARYGGTVEASRAQERRPSLPMAWPRMASECMGWPEACMFSRLVCRWALECRKWGAERPSEASEMALMGTCPGLEEARDTRDYLRIFRTNLILCMYLCYFT